MEKFVNGDCIKDVANFEKKGVIADTFYYKWADDGTQNYPGADMYPIQWDDGTRGYRHASQLEYS